jgi:hypothetical protein
VLQSSGQTVAHQFHIATLEHPENQNAVSIAGPQPACGCPDFRARPGFCCQHILFVYIHVLKHPNAAAIYAQMGGGSAACRLVPPIPKSGEVCCGICFAVMVNGGMDMGIFNQLIAAPMAAPGGSFSAAGPARNDGVSGPAGAFGADAEAAGVDGAAAGSLSPPTGMAFSATASAAPSPVMLSSTPIVPMHAACVEAWRRGILRHLPTGVPSPRGPAELDVTQKKVVQADGGILVAIPVKIV